PAPARAILEELGADEKLIDRVCFLIAHHHTYDGIDGLDYQILLEADFLVNAYEDQLKPEAIIHFRDKVFRTPSGLQLLKDTYHV
ncbi:MAG: phosphohydrolase, partial [Megasphaera elsdenii]|nr:phosphohydrolase [Megasphaera elsdenii]